MQISLTVREKLFDPKFFRQFQPKLALSETAESQSKHAGQLKGSVKEPNILIYFYFPPITQSCSRSDVLFTGGRGVSDFSVLKYY